MTAWARVQRPWVLLLRHASHLAPGVPSKCSLHPSPTVSFPSRQHPGYALKNSKDRVSVHSVRGICPSLGLPGIDQQAPAAIISWYSMTGPNLSILRPVLAVLLPILPILRPILRVMLHVLLWVLRLQCVGSALLGEGDDQS